MSVSLREATREDVDAIANLHAESWRATYRGALSDEYLDGPVFEDRVQTWTERLTHPEPTRYVVVAEEDGDVLGFACAEWGDRQDLGTLLDNLHVRPDLKGQGIGKRLVCDVARWCVANHPERGMWLGVLEQNARARRFYEGLGSYDAGGETWHREESDGAPIRVYAWTPERVMDLAGAGV